MDGKTIYIIDLDGTLYDNSHRQHLIPTDRSSTAEWRAFNNACANDKVRHPVRRLVQTLINAGEHVIFLTGRGASAYIPSAKQLDRDFVGGPHPLLMRPMDDHRPAWQFKVDALLGLRQAYPGCHLLAIEDDDNCVQSMRNIPFVTVLQINSLCVAHNTSKLPGVSDGK